jgi:hypothetical protein
VTDVACDRLLVVTQRTRLDELLHRFNTRAQARFYVEHMGLDFADYEREHETYRRAVDGVVDALGALPLKLQALDRTLVPNAILTPQHVVVVVGRDGLDGQPLVGVNPDPSRWDGVLLPFAPPEAAAAVEAAATGAAPLREIAMAEARLNDGQRLLAFNDLLVGRRSHVSARYRLTWRGRSEEQSSSGVLVATGAGSTGWLSSTRNMAQAMAELLLGEAAPQLPELRLDWADRRLAFVVREPFRSRRSGVELAAGMLAEGETLQLESLMPEGGVLFSDGVEDDAVAFDSGAVATVGLAERRTRLVVRAPRQAFGVPTRPASMTR